MNNFFLLFSEQIIFVHIEPFSSMLDTLVMSFPLPLIDSAEHLLRAYPTFYSQLNAASSVQHLLLHHP